MQAVRRKILFVEDHDDTRDLFSIVLDQSNYEVMTSASMAGALRLAETEKFDLFVLDSLLADGTGLELCKRIRQTDDSTPILFYSALAYENDKNEAFLSGAQRYLVKPVDIPVLCNTVAEMLNVSDELNGNGNGHRSSRTQSE
jgi:DNA-binding response OmpR family regulator